MDIIGGVPGRLGDGTTIWAASRQGAKALIAGEAVVTGPDLHVRKRARDRLGRRPVRRLPGAEDPASVLAFTWSAAGGVEQIGTAAAGVEAAWRAGGTTVLARSDLEEAGTEIIVLQGGEVAGRIDSVAETPVIFPSVQLARVGARQLSTGVLFPARHERGSARLPVLLDPYGGPHFQRVLATSQRWLESQWWADQGFCVVVTDGRGTPGRGDEFERADLQGRGRARPRGPGRRAACRGRAARGPRPLQSRHPWLVVRGLSGRIGGPAEAGRLPCCRRRCSVH